MYPKKYSHFEVHSEAFHNLKKQWSCYVRGEVLFKNDQMVPYFGRTRKSYRNARFDIAIFNPDESLKLVIEIKPTKNGGRIPQGKQAPKQGDFYKRLTNGVPCLYIRGMNEAMNATKIVNDFLGLNLFPIS